MQEKKNAGLLAMADALEAACIETLESGIMTKDLVSLAEGIETKAVNSAEFLRAIRGNLDKKLQ